MGLFDNDKGLFEELFDFDGDGKLSIDEVFVGSMMAADFFDMDDDNDDYVDGLVDNFDDDE